MPDSEIVTFSPELRAAMQRIYDNSKRRCMDTYLDMLRSMSGMPEDQLINAALNLERGIETGEQMNGAFGNHWLQALSIKNPISALLVSEMIVNGDLPESN